MNNRIRILRKHLSLTQEEFSSKIGIGKSALSRIESGVNNPSEQTLKLICSEFHVRRDWLLNGEEPMLLPPDENDEIVDAVLAGEDPYVKAIIRGIAKTPGGWEKMRDLFNAIQEELKKNTPEA